MRATRWLLAAGVTFNGSNQYTATLINPSFPATTTRRFGKLAGTATTSQTRPQRATTGSTTTPPSGRHGDDDSHRQLHGALVIDTPVLMATNGGAAPAATMIEGGTAQTHTAAQFAFTASNNPGSQRHYARRPAARALGTSTCRRSRSTRTMATAPMTPPTR